MGVVNKSESVASNRGPVRNSEPMKSPGMLRKHYSPRARLVVCAWADDAQLKRQLSEFDIASEQIHVIAHTHIPGPADLGRICVIPHDAEAYARALYAELHCCDQEGARLIVVEEPPAAAEWQGIRDRLERAAAK
jgi:L-threonylcarbamoyladenylate synthase